MSSALSRYIELENGIAGLASQLYATTYRLLVLIREFDEEGLWHNTGAKSCAHWLNWRIGLNLSAAYEKVRVAHMLKDLPLICAAFSQGRISYTKVRAMTRVANPKNEKNLLAIAFAGTAFHVEQLVARYRKVEDLNKVSKAQQKHYVQTYYDNDGMLVIRGRLSSSEGALLRQALSKMTQTNYDPKLTDERSCSEKQADALALMADQILKQRPNDRSTHNSFQVVIHVEQKNDAACSSAEESALRREEVSAQESADSPYIDNGPGLSLAEFEHLSCDAEKITMVHNEKGRPIDVGRRSRTIPTRLRLALKERDDGCKFPGCTHKAFVDGHHIKHWSKGGATNLDNLVLLCRMHHRFIHEEGYRIEKHSAGELQFYHPKGWLMPASPPLPTWVAANVRSESPPEPAPYWQGEKMDYSLALLGLL